jgi:cobalt-zinc-cadmium efflux system protein
VRLLADPGEIASTAMIVFDVVGLVGNIVSISILAGVRGADVNVRAASSRWSALGSVAVLTAHDRRRHRADRLDQGGRPSIAAHRRSDPARTWRLLRESVDVLLESTGVDLAAVRRHLLSVPHVHGVHDLHATMVATGLPVLTAHVVVDDDWRRRCLSSLPPLALLLGFLVSRCVT